jgi:AcrR family transcriptional regulator
MDASDADGHGKRGRDRPRLTADRIAAVALELLDEQGVAAVTMRAVADGAGVRPMSLYRHFSDRDRMLDAVVDRVVNELGEDPEVPRTPIQGWRPYLEALARGVRRYARRHPHAFPLVATRPSEAPWINPPLRSIRWVESMLTALLGEGFTDEQTLFAYRVFNSFLLGYLLLETSAMALADPRPGDGSYEPRAASGGKDPVSTDTPIPGGLTPTRDRSERHAVADADNARELLDPQDQIDRARFPTVHRLAAGLAEDRWDAEFDVALEHMLDRIAAVVGR